MRPIPIQAILVNFLRDNCHTVPDSSTFSWVTRAVTLINERLRVPQIWQIIPNVVARSGASTASLSVTPTDGLSQITDVQAGLRDQHGSWNVVSTTGGADDGDYTFVSALKAWYTDQVKALGIRNPRPWEAKWPKCPNITDVHQTAVDEADSIVANLQNVYVQAAKVDGGTRFVDVNYPYVVPDSPTNCSRNHQDEYGATAAIDQLDQQHEMLSFPGLVQVDLRNNLDFDTGIQHQILLGYPHPSASGQQRIAELAVARLLSNLGQGDTATAAVTPPSTPQASTPRTSPSPLTRSADNPSAEPDWKLLSYQAAGCPTRDQFAPHTQSFDDATVTVHSHDFTGDGRPDVYVSFQCPTTTSSQPDIVAVFDITGAAPRLLGTLGASARHLDAYFRGATLVAKASTLTMSGPAIAGSDALAGPQHHATLVYRWTKNRFLLTAKTLTFDGAVMRKLLDGTHHVFIRDINLPNVTVDSVDWFEGPAAAKACAEDGVTETARPCADLRFYFRNKNPLLRTMTISTVATVAYTDASGQTVLKKTSDLPAVNSVYYQSQDLPIRVVVKGGVIIAMAQETLASSPSLHSGFVSMTGNIRCWARPHEATHGNVVDCNILSTDFIEHCDIQPGAVMSIGATGQASYDPCQGDYLIPDIESGTPTFIPPHGSSVDLGVATCSVSQNGGVTCRNAEGHGFSLSRSSHTTF